MLKELTVAEMEDLASKLEIYSEAQLFLEESATRIKNGEKIKVKEKITKTTHSIVCYRYDKELYRYSICGEFFLKD